MNTHRRLISTVYIMSVYIQRCTQYCTVFPARHRPDPEALAALQVAAQDFGRSRQLGNELFNLRSRAQIAAEYNFESTTSLRPTYIPAPSGKNRD